MGSKHKLADWLGKRVDILLTNPRRNDGDWVRGALRLTGWDGLYFQVTSVENQKVCWWHSDMVCAVELTEEEEADGGTENPSEG